MNDDIRQDIYKMYMAETLYAMSDGKRLDVHYKDVLNPPKEDPRSGQDIISSISKKLEEGGKS